MYTNTLNAQTIQYILIFCINYHKFNTPNRNTTYLQQQSTINKHKQNKHKLKKKKKKSKQKNIYHTFQKINTCVSFHVSIIIAAPSFYSACESLSSPY